MITLFTRPEWCKPIFDDPDGFILTKRIRGLFSDKFYLEQIASFQTLEHVARHVGGHRVILNNHARYYSDFIIDDYVFSST